MPEYIIRPRRHNYYSTYENQDANYPCTNAYDNDPDSYWTFFDTSKSGFKSNYPRTFDNFDFTQIPNNEVVDSVAVCIDYATKKYSSDTLYWTCYLQAAKARSTSSSLAISDEIDEDSHMVKNKAALTKVHDEYLSEASVSYINTNKSSIISGSKIYGIFIQPGYFDKEYLHIYDIYIKVTTHRTGSNIYFGGANISSAYLGSTPVDIYLGSNKLL